MGLKPTGTVRYEHQVFGKKSFVEDHQKFIIELKQIGPGAKGVAKFEVMCQGELCSDIGRMPSGPWVKKLEDKGVWLSDVGDGPGAEIEILVGAKEYAEMLTGQNHKLDNGLVTVETSVGWTVFGRGGKELDSGSTLVSSTVCPPGKAVETLTKTGGHQQAVPWWAPGRKFRACDRDEDWRAVPWWAPGRAHEQKKTNRQGVRAWWEPGRNVRAQDQDESARKVRAQDQDEPARKVRAEDQDEPARKIRVQEHGKKNRVAQW